MCDNFKKVQLSLEDMSSSQFPCATSRLTLQDLSLSKPKVAYKIIKLEGTDSVGIRISDEEF